MNRFDDYPYAQVRAALGTMLGRICLVVIAIVVGSILGGWTATRSLHGLWLGFAGLPDFSFASFFYGVGFFVFPALLFYAVFSIRWGWPLALTAICTVLMWWNIHRTIRWTVYDSPMAKQQQQFQVEMDQAIKRANDERRSHSQQ